MNIGNNSLNSTKTDLAFLLECLKFQMKCPDSQKQALQTIFTICQKREEHVDLFRELGGVEFVYNLSKSSIVNSGVQETAMFMLGTLAETNAFCKKFLCRREIFSDLSALLRKADSLLTQKRVAVYMLSVLIVNNKTGQILAQTTGCLNILLDLFRTSFPLSRKTALKPDNAAQIHLLWTSLSTTLCGCVNNPQNEEAQCACLAAFPMVKSWLQDMTIHCTELIQPICSFIAMTVANNSCAQESFYALGGLQSLVFTLVRFVSDAEKSPVSCKISVIITKTLSTCITDNPILASGLAKYGMVPQLLSLLSNPSLQPQDMLCVMITLGQLTEASEEHKSQLVNYGGLPAIVTLVTEAPIEELKKAAMFILQSYKKARQDGGLYQSEKESVGPTNMGTFQRSAKEMQQRIDELEDRECKVVTEGSTPPAEKLRTMTRQPHLHQGETSHCWLGEGEGQLRYEHGGEGHSEKLKEFTPLCSFECTNYVDKSQVRRKIFQTTNETQKSACKGRVKEKVRISVLSIQNSDSDCSADADTNHRIHTESGESVYVNLQDVLRGLRENADRNSEKPEEMSHIRTQTEQAKRVHDNYQVPKKLMKCNNAIPSVLLRPITAQARQPEVTCSRCKASVNLVSSHVAPAEVARELPSERKVSKNAVPIKRRVPKDKWIDDEDALLLCSDLLESEIRSSPETVYTPSKYRCTGCVLRFEEVTSRTFTALQSSCQCSCDMHARLQEATDLYRAHLLPLLGVHSSKCEATPCRPPGNDCWRGLLSQGSPEPGVYMCRAYTSMGRLAPAHVVRITPMRRGEKRLVQHDRLDGITLIPRYRRPLMSRD